MTDDSLRIHEDASSEQNQILCKHNLKSPLPFCFTYCCALYFRGILWGALRKGHRTSGDHPRCCSHGYFPLRVPRYPSTSPFPFRVVCKFFCCRQVVIVKWLCLGLLNGVLQQRALTLHMLEAEWSHVRADQPHALIRALLGASPHG